MLTIVLLILVLCLSFYHYCVLSVTYWRRLGVKQLNSTWFFGDFLNIILKREGFNEALVRFYNEFPNHRYFGIYQFLLPTLVIKDVDLISEIAVTNFEYFLDHRPFIPDDVDLLWSRNLFALKGQRWREMRRTLSPFFTSSKIKGMFTLMTDVAETFTAFFQHKGGEEVIEVEMKDVFTRYGNDIIASLAFGIEVNSLENPNSQFYLIGKQTTDFGTFGRRMKIFGYLLFPKLYTIFKIPIFEKEITEFFTGLVNEVIKTREEQNVIRPDLIHLLLEARKGNHKHEETTSVETGYATVKESDHGKDLEFHKRDITNVDIAAQALIFFFAGFETVTTAMSFMAYELSVNPDIQNRLRDEIEQTKQECNGKITYEALMKMKYLDMVISETLRKWPSAISVDRVCTKSFTIQSSGLNEKPLTIRKGEVIWFPILAIHRDPKYYPEPDKFDPERFSDKNKHSIKHHTYLPFGIGPRNCIGSRFALLECKIFFYHLLLNFELVPTEKTRVPLELVKSSFVPKIEGGNWLGIKRIVKSKND